MLSCKRFACPKCGKVLFKKNLWSHLKVVHYIEEEELYTIREQINRETGAAKINCPLCEELFTTYKELAEHCNRRHSKDGAGGRPQDYSILSLEFANEQEYEVFCNRGGAGVKPLKATERVTTSKKDVRHCSCYLVVRLENDGRVSVEGCFGHVGHDLDPALLRLSAQQKFYLRTLLEGNILCYNVLKVFSISSFIEHSMEYIIKRLQKEDPSRSSKLSYIMKKDLTNIVAQYNMRPGWRHDDDITSVQLRCTENNPDDGIRIFEPPHDPSGAGFLMVIITPTMLDWMKKYSCRGVTLDDTFHTTRYNLKLATLMVTDERDRGLPTAFLLSGTMTSADVRRMFIEIQSLMPEFEPDKIVTDEAPCFYNGFRAVFPQAKTRLHYCRFHILQTWKRKMNKLVEPSLRTSVHAALRNLLNETQLPTFERRFAEILAYLKTKDQRQMAEYLEKNYLGRTPSWASFANRGAVLDTTMISERFHLRIKEEFLHRNANSRVDGFVELLIRAVEEIANSIDVKERRRFVNCAYRLTETHKRHKAAAEMYKGSTDLIVEADTNSWQIQNRARTKVYEVKWEGPCSCDPQKNTHCLMCGVCAYDWFCTCSDNRAGISCIHRHAIKMHISGQADENTTRATSAETATVHDVDVVTTEAQRRQETLHQLFNTATMTYAAVEACLRSAIRANTDEAVVQLQEVIAHLQLAYGVVSVYRPGALAARPEVSRAGGKPRLSKIPILRRSSVQKPRVSEEGDRLHSEVLKMQQLSPFKDVQH
ncbi:unnamed protein product [Nippostrongylus brasiliensis]|uniref:C2H2-type domain-containing protein n=1 Tax=Nippostrongylus brasiliensis TaxID=27835 RepID=A0A0N4XIW6_NIPBR|nr:unnamed protein product [Nippostrongylus brasiliensis]